MDEIKHYHKRSWHAFYELELANSYLFRGIKRKPKEWAGLQELQASSVPAYPINLSLGSSNYEWAKAIKIGQGLLAETWCEHEGGLVLASQEGRGVAQALILPHPLS